MPDLDQLNRQAARLAKLNRTERRVYESLERGGAADNLVDILTSRTRYIHYSLPDGQTLIFDISGYDMVATAPNADHTLTVFQDGEAIKLEPIGR